MRVTPTTSDADYLAAYLDDWREANHAQARDSGRGFLHREELVVQRMLDAGCATLLDVGCADGYLSRLAVRRARERGVRILPTLCDVHQEILDFAERNVLRESPDTPPSKRLALVESIPDHSLVYDAVAALEVVEHVRDPRAFVAKLRTFAVDRVFLTTPVGGAYDDPMHIWHWQDEAELRFALGLDVFRSVSIDRIPSQVSDSWRVFLVEAIP